jgi:hypothetical protein
MRERYELGVLVVHGIGGQRRGDTLLDIAEPLVRSLGDWMGPESVEFEDVELIQASGGRPAHVRLTVRSDGRTTRLLIAESWWADTFYPPGWWALASWLVWAVPFVVFRAADHGISVIDTNDKLDDARKRHRIRDWLLVLFYVAVRLIKNVVSVALVLVTTGVLLLAGIVAVIPRARRAILSGQRLLIRYIGDSYCLLTSPVRAEATIAQVERDLEWVEGEITAKVAIIAHSQGAELARRVIARRERRRPIAGLITFGAGIAKLRAVERLYGAKWRALVAYLVRAGAAVLTVAGPVLWLRYDRSLWLAIACLGGAALLFTGVRKMLRHIVQAEQLAADLGIGPGNVERWYDYYASSDPVPEGPLPVADLGLKVGISMRIANLRSPIRDHSGYTANGEAFRPAVLAALGDLIGWMTPPARAVVNNARKRRARTTMQLVSDRIVIGGLVVAWFVMRAFDLATDFTDDVAEWLAEAAGWVAAWFSADAEAWLEAPSRRDLVAGVMLVLAAAAVYAVGAWLWGLLATRRAQRILRRPPGKEALGVTSPFLRRFVYERLARHAEKVDRKVGWDHHPQRLKWLMPRLRGEFILFGLRYRLRQHNLYDEVAADPPQRVKAIGRTTHRTADGRGTDLGDPAMGAACTHFGRSGLAIPQRTDEPKAADISKQLLARKEFLPATSLNLLAASWLQFEVHDWLQHRPRRYWDAAGGPLDPTTPPLEQTDASRTGAPRFISDQTHWWDASQLYGVDPEFTAALRVDGGRVKTGDELLEAIEPFLFKAPSPVPNFWLGLAVFHDLFAHEHNAICAALEHAEDLEGEALFAKARLVNAALMAKIHTIEWTPTVIGHPTSARAILATWWGLLGPRARRWLGHIGGDEVLSGIPGSHTHHDGVRYSLTEEFVAVYRMHPLIPDEVRFYEIPGDQPRNRFTFEELAVAGRWASQPRKRLTEVGGVANAIYSLGMGHPGQITLHNYPDFLRRLPLPTGGKVDLAKRDIERVREAALPRYNEFRRVFRRSPVKSFTELTGADKDPDDDRKRALAEELRGFYGSVEDVDLMVGLFAEPVPRGFAFSDTAFRVFLLMAARRLRSDRFFTTDFTPDVYTPTGFRWVQSRTMQDMLREHYPQLREVLPPGGNVFTPWRERP